MPVNISRPELRETLAEALPPASLNALKTMREEMCAEGVKRDFTLQPQQRFLRRVLSPDSPVRNLLMFHGTGSGKTCSAIQVAEEYILRPEFQDKRVLVLANPAVQSNFISSIFDLSRVVIDNEGILTSKQCTGRRYLDMLQRVQSDPKRWSDPVVRDRLRQLSNKLVSEFYEFKGYNTFANEILEQEEHAGRIDKWIHEHYDNRMIIVDEAHAFRDVSDGTTGKIRSLKLKQIIQTAENVTLIMLTATPMFDTYDEMLYYFNLFLWNDRRLEKRREVKPAEYFTKSGEFVSAEKEREFRGWCQDYISFVRGDNPLTFPFRLPPPDDMIASPTQARDNKNRAIPKEEKRKYLPLVASIVQGDQAEALVNDKQEIQSNVVDSRVICVLPKSQPYSSVFENGTDAAFRYKKDIPAFLSPSQVANYSAKFHAIMNILEESVGIVFVFSNLVEYGSQLFSMCLEEHGFEPAFGRRLLENTSGEVQRGARGRYVHLSDLSDAEFSRAMIRLKSRDNVAGQDIRVIVASPKIAEGVDFAAVRQVHVLDPWFNMSRLEQVVGRGIRTCSHRNLPFEHQNCTVYYHICRFPESNREIRDETIYRVHVEIKAVAIAKIKKVIMESAMDCPLELEVNRLPADWRGLMVTQVRSQRQQSVQLPLEQMSSPMFGVNLEDLTCKVVELPAEEDHTRPLSAVLDVRDEILDKLLKLFARKSVWTKDELSKSAELRRYDHDVLAYVLQDAVETLFRIKDRNGRVGHIESRGDMYAFATGSHDTLQERIVPFDSGKVVPLPKHAPVKETPPRRERIDIETMRNAFKWVANAQDRFSPEVLDWFITDHILDESERLQYLKTLDWSNPPFYLASLKTDGLFLFGPDHILDADMNETTPIGAQADALQRWKNILKQRYLDTRDQFFATMKGNTILFNLDEKSKELKRATRAKNIGGRACTNFPEPLLNQFAEWLSGSPLPKEVKTKPDRCQYIALLLREALVAKREGIVWWNPEEWAFLNEDATKKDLLAQIKL